MSVEELAAQADVEVAHVRRLIELGGLEGGDGSFGPAHVRRIRLLRAWEEAGLSVEGILHMVRTGALSLAFLDSPVMARAQYVERTYQLLTEEEGFSLPVIRAAHEALGFAPPEPSHRVREDDLEVLALVRNLLAGGAGEAWVLRLLRVYADSLRRVAKAEAELYESEIEGRLRASGRTERELMDFGTEFGERVIASLEQAILAVYHRHREHVWIEHSVNHAEVALEQAGLYDRIPRPPSICFVDLTGYTKLTEEQGDQVAAQLAARLASLVEGNSQRYGGRPIRWLGDGGMFHFKEPRAAVLSALDMVESAPGAGLPPTHIGIHTGPVIFQDGDVYGRTVNLASRIASHAGAGQVLVSEDTIDRVGEGVRFEPLGEINLKGIARPVSLYEAVRV